MNFANELMSSSLLFALHFFNAQSVKNKEKLAEIMICRPSIKLRSNERFNDKELEMTKTINGNSMITRSQINNIGVILHYSYEICIVRIWVKVIFNTFLILTQREKRNKINGKNGEKFMYWYADYVSLLLLELE